jgi:hypothetical protein
LNIDLRIAKTLGLSSLLLCLENSREGVKWVLIKRGLFIRSIDVIPGEGFSK